MGIFSFWVIALMIITLLLILTLSPPSALSFLLYGARTLLNRSKKRWSSSSARLLPLGTLGWPFIGETIEFISCAYTDSPESFMEKRCGLYGKVFKSHLFGSHTIVSTDPEFSKIVLQSGAKIFVPSYPKSLTELMGNSSILLINGSLQKKMHGLFAFFFKLPHLRTRVTSDMQNYVQRSMATWTEHAPVLIQNEAKKVSSLVYHIIKKPGSQFIATSDQDDWDNRVAFQVLVKVLIGLDPGDEMELLRMDFQEFMRGLMSLPVKIPGSQLYRSLKAKRRMVKLVENIISRKRNSPPRSDIPQDIIDVLLFNGDEQLSDNLISDNMIDLMIPGEDSVPILMTLAVEYLSECPRAQQKLTVENLRLKDEKYQHCEPLRYSDYLSLTFTQMVITETLRLGNIISGVMRKATRDLEIKGFCVPKGWCVFTYFRSVHLDEAHYDSPYNFNPWRWLEKSPSCSSSHFSPFGGGQRLCPGLDLARLEVSIFLHQLVTNFRWSAEEDTVINFPNEEGHADPGKAKNRT